jgi:hypothetical protein
MKKHRDQPDTAAPKREPYRVHLPGMLIVGEIGLGDLIKNTTYKIGIQPCGGCEQRAAALNRWVTLSRS